MRIRVILGFAVLALLALGATGASAQEFASPEARECVATVNDCPDEAITTKEVQLGGQGSASSNDG